VARMYRSANALVDEQTFRLAQAGDPTAIQNLLIRLQPDVRRYARKQCRSSSAIEDVVQEALLVVYRRIGQVRDLASLSGWIAKIVLRLCMLPALMFMRGIEDLTEIENTARFARISTDELRIDLVRALESLSPHLREVILMRDLQEMTIGEIAHALKTTRAAVKARLHRARHLIREYLQGEGEHGIA
jgi:RNA polymerase sigma factor (sigma-70 family)